RAAGREQDVAVAIALGAARDRIIRQLLTESVLLSLVGGVLGLVIGIVGVHALLALSSGDVPRIGPHGSGVALDWRVLAFTAAISIGSGIVFGLVPALRVSRVDVHSVLKNGNTRTTDRNHHRIRSFFVIGEMALAVVLVIGTSLLIRTFIALRSVDPGFHSRNLTTMSMSVKGSKFTKTANMGQMVQRATEELERIP